MNLDIYIVIALILFSIILNIIPVKNKDNIFIIISFLVLFVVLIIREPYSDMIRYLQVFNNTNLHNLPVILKLRWEKLYLLLNWTIKLFTSNERIFISIISFLSLIGYYKFIKKYSKNYLISLLLFIILGFYNYNFYVIRQAIALSILLMSVKHICDKSFLKFLIYVLVASGFHSTSLVFLIAYPICNFSLNIIGIFIYIIFYIFALFAKNKIMTLIYRFTKYDSYFISSDYSDGINKLIILIIIVIFSLFIIYMYDRKKIMSKKILKKREKWDINTVFINMLMIGIFFQILATERSIVSRLSSIFITSTIILLPNIIFNIKEKKIRFIIIVVLLICIIIYALYYPTIVNYYIILNI